MYERLSRSLLRAALQLASLVPRPAEGMAPHGGALLSIPQTLDGWSLEVIGDLCARGQVETDRYDFKFGLPSTENLTKLCCAFANSQGGFVVLGVRERSGHHLPEGSDQDAEIARDFGHKLKAEPSIYFESPRMVRTGNSRKVLYIFHVPLSGDRPHYDQVAQKFWKRSNTGSEPMTLEEIRNQFMNYEERRSLLKLLFIELIENKALLHSVKGVTLGRYPLRTLDSSVLDRLLVDLYSVVQDDPELIKLLLAVRRDIRACNVHTQIFFSQMGQTFSGLNAKVQMADEHTEFMRDRADHLIPLFDRAISILQSRFSLRDPLLGMEAPSPLSASPRH